MRAIALLTARARGVSPGILRSPSACLKNRFRMRLRRYSEYCHLWKGAVDALDYDRRAMAIFIEVN